MRGPLTRGALKISAILHLAGVGEAQPRVHAHHNGVGQLLGLSGPPKRGVSKTTFLEFPSIPLM